MLRAPQHERNVLDHFKSPPFVPSTWLRTGSELVEGLRGSFQQPVNFQLEDKLFSPDIPHQDSAFIHRLAVRRKFAGGEVSSALLLWAIARTLDLGRRYLRLDCEASPPRLRAAYERMGFRFHSNKHVGPCYVARYEYDVMELSPAEKRNLKT